MSEASTPMDEVEALWNAALAHAGYSAGAARLYLIQGAIPVGRSAMWLKPNSRVYATPEIPLDQSQLRDANDVAHRWLHRICMFTQASSEVAGVMLRHELEHARQYDRAGRDALFKFNELVHYMQTRQFGGLPQSGRIYNAIPTESDANAAAAAFAREQFARETIAAQLTGEHAVLFRTPGEPDPTSVGLRLLCHAAIWRTAFEEVLREERAPLAPTLESVSPAGPSLWQEIAADAEFSALANAVATESPDATLHVLPPEQVTLAWGRWVSRVDEAQRRAEELAGIAPSVGGNGRSD